MKRPHVTVLMSVYNSEKYLREAIDSILAQTFNHFEFLIVNDCSSDSSFELMKSYNDSRIRIIKNPTNIGLTRSLNIGISNAKGEYIVRMDADDISCHNRLELLVQYMDNNPDVGICGSWAETIEKSPRKLTPDCSPENIRTELFFHNIIIHPSVIIRKSVLEGNHLEYNEKLLFAQDYDLWVKCSKYTKITNLPEFLLRYRISNTQLSSNRLINQHKSAMDTRVWILRQLGIKVTPEEFDIHAFLIYCICFEAEHIFQNLRQTSTSITSEKLFDWILKIVHSNRVTGVYDPELFEHKLLSYLIGSSMRRHSYKESMNSLNLSNKDIKGFRKLIYFWFKNKNQ
jgi:glycosyltransferase involved in cell wall biosynthesis